MLCTTTSISVVRLNLEFEVNDYVMHSYFLFALNMYFNSSSIVIKFSSNS